MNKPSPQKPRCICGNIAAKKKIQCEVCIQIQELLKTPHGNYPDKSVEYAIAYALIRAGVEKLEFDSYGCDPKIQLNSITAYPCIRIGGSSLLIDLFKYFNFGLSGGSCSEWMQASFLFKADKDNYKRYIKGYRIFGETEEQIFMRIYCCFYWLKQYKDDPKVIYSPA